MFRYEGHDPLGILLICALATACSFSDGTVVVRRTQGSQAESALVDFSRRLESGVFRRANPQYDFGTTGASEILVEGFSAPERHGSSEFTWAISKQAQIRLHVFDDDSEWIHFAARPFVIGQDHDQVVSVHLNESTVGSVTLPRGDFTEYSLPIPRGALTFGDNIITFNFSYAEAPNPLFFPSATETRTLAAAFDYIEITSDPQAGNETTRRAAGPERSWSGTTDKISLPSNSEIIFPIRVPRAAAIEFGLERRGGDPTNSVRGEIGLRTQGLDIDEEVFFEGDLDGGPWRADLSAWEGEQISLVFRAVGGGDTEEIAWVGPRLFGDVGIMNTTTNVVLIILDTFRADHLGSYGGAAKTVNIDRLATSGVRFEQVYSHIPITVPSHGSIFTSQLPTEHGALNNNSILSDAHTTLAELMRDAYRTTAGFVSLGVLRRHVGVAQGFDQYHDGFQADWWKNAQEMNEQLVPWLQEDRSEPFFLFAHYSDPHEPYAPPNRQYPTFVASYEGQVVGEFVADGTTTQIKLEISSGISELTLTAGSHYLGKSVQLSNLRSQNPESLVTCTKGCRERAPRPSVTAFVTSFPATILIDRADDAPVSSYVRFQASEVLSNQQARERYREEVEYLDTAVGQLLAAIEAADTHNDTMVILTADHGEELGEHGAFGHVTRLYEPAIRVPLLISWPGRLPAGEVISAPVSHIDLLPTIVDLLELDDTERRSGQSLRPLLDGVGEAFSARAVVAETFRPESARDRRALIADGFKLILTPQDSRTELYDLGHDPGEIKNISTQDPQMISSLSRILRTQITRAEANATKSEEQALTDEQIQRLRSLGYVR